MRYLGNKDSIVAEIEQLLIEKCINSDKFIFFDAFCGTGSVADYLKSTFQITINDNLTWSTFYARGRICALDCTFERLGFDPFVFFNSNQNQVKGFIYNNYAPTQTDRMYFSPHNAGRIDYFRQKIEEWWTTKKISENEYCFLLACLIESVSSVSNTAGVYGAYLKKWDSRATKEITFNRVVFRNDLCESIKVYNEKVEDIIEEVECDILYLDPPYTQNQYGTQYHLLETLVLDDNPSISAITGSRSTSSMRSDWSKEYKVNILFDRVLAKTKAKYIVMSYSSDGFMSKSYIEAAMKRYGKPETYVCKKISYKKYQNWKSKKTGDHFEYLFFVEKKDSADVFYESPLNYIGSKAKIISNIIEYQPKGYDTMIDAFGGGFNVGVNFSANRIIYNDANHLVAELISSFREWDTYAYLLYIKKMIKKFGLERADADSYIAARKYYNELPAEKRDPRLLFTIILYGFQQQIRFNSKHEFNNPVGMRWFNDKVLEKMIGFSRRIKEIPFEKYDGRYEELEGEMTEKTFVYFDPPYMLTTGAYNDGKRGFYGWDEKLEEALFSFADRLTEKNIPFMLSYVIEHKGNKNNNLIEWIEKNKYNVIELGDVLGISGSRRKEVLIINYEK